MARLQPQKTPQKGNIDKSFLSVIFGNDLIEKELTDKDEEKVDLFEKGLASGIDKEDTVEKAIEKIVKAALASEFGPSFVLQKGSKKMIQTISHGIVSDQQLRHQALIIMDKFADSRTRMPSIRKKG